MSRQLSARKLTVRFGGQARPALSDVTLDVASGSFTVVVGPSGCGKSTLLNCFAGLLRATSGEALEEGSPITEPSPSRGVVFQRDVLFPWASVRANLEFALKASGVRRSERPARVERLLRAVHLPPDIARSKPRHLSGGMRQRVGIARMMASEPEVMLMDEPFGALDAQTRLRMQDLVTEIWADSGRTVVFITHDVDEAIRLADRIVVLAEGQVRSVVENPLERPRPEERLAELTGYSGLRRHLFELLQPSAASAATSA